MGRGEGGAEDERRQERACTNERERTCSPSARHCQGSPTLVLPLIPLYVGAYSRADV